MLPPLPLLSLVVENCHYLLVSGPFLAHKFSRLRFSADVNTGYSLVECLREIDEREAKHEEC